MNVLTDAVLTVLTYFTMSGRKVNNNFSKLKFDLIKVNGKYAAKCHFCEGTIKNTRQARLQAHRNVCRNIQMSSSSTENTHDVASLEPLEEQNISIQEGTYTVMTDGTLLHNNSTKNKDSVMDNSSSTSILSTPPSINRRKRRITDYMDQVSEEEELNINKSLAKMIFGCNLPFSLVDSQHFKNFVKAIRPAYVEKIPGRKKLSTTLLEKCYEDCINNARNNLGQEVVIVCDGWKNSSNNTKIIVTMLHATEGPSVFIDAWDVTAEAETAEKLAAIITESKQIAKEKYNVDAYGVISDNASPMIKMGSLLEHSMWHSTCNSHIGNLLAKDLLSKETCDNLMLIMKEMKKPDLEKLLVSKGGHRIKLPAETRWCSYRDCFKNFIENLGYIKQIIAETKKKIKPKVKELVFNDDFIEEVKHSFNIQDPICNLINVCQNPETSIADAVHLWLNLCVPEQYNEQLKRRQEMAFNKYALVAYYFHPLYDNEKLTHIQKQRINQFLFKHLNNDGINQWDLFNTKSAIFKNLLDKQIQKPLVFWRIASTECPQLSHLVLKLLKMPAASANIERLFSNWGNIHTLLRNRLTFTHSKKLLHIYFTLKECNNNNDDECDDNNN